LFGPSTDREYYISVPESKNVWAAKAWTFNNKKIEIRHGDVGLLNINKNFLNQFTNLKDYEKRHDKKKNPALSPGAK